MGEELFDLLDVDPIDRSELLAGRPDPARWPQVRRLRRELVDAMGRVGANLPWETLDDPLVQPWALLSTVDDVRAYHRSRGVADDVSWATLADLGQHLRLGRRLLGHTGLGSPGWLTLHFRGLLYRLGRLQFERIVVGVRHLRAIWPDAREDLPAVSVHIPESGPLTDAACDDAFARAATFFATCFPEVGYRTALCHSWLLDEQLRAYLPEDSNILRFARRFRPVPPEDRQPDDAQVLDLVFHRRSPDLATLPQDTTLQRAIVTHLNAGRHWYFRAGWCEL